MPGILLDMLFLFLYNLFVELTIDPLRTHLRTTRHSPGGVRAWQIVSDSNLEIIGSYNFWEKEGLLRSTSENTFISALRPLSKSSILSSQAMTWTNSALKLVPSLDWFIQILCVSSNLALKAKPHFW